MTSRLALLHSRLTRLRRVRAAVVWLAAAAGFAAAVLAGLLTVFLFDWLFGLDIYQRLLVMGLAAAAVVYFSRRFWRELAELRGDEIQAALWVERQHQIDSDLVAAIQFERQSADPIASRGLTAAVVEYVADAAPTIDVFHGFSAGPLGRRLARLAICVALAGALTALAPAHVRAFGQRLLLSSRAYPTRTRIERVLVGEMAVFEAGRVQAALAEAKAAEARPLRFTVSYSGVRPRSASVHVQSLDRAGPVARVPLEPAQGTGGPSPELTGELPRFHEDVRYWIVAGDARSAVGMVRMIPLPVVEVEVRARPPAYAAGHEYSGDGEGAAANILEGSAVELVVVCANKKPLQSVVATLDGPAQEKRELIAADSQKTRWKLPPGDTLLAAMKADVRYEIEAVDADGLSPLAPLRGVIRVHPDAAPSAAASVVHRLVLPGAQPVVGYKVADDYGIARLELVVDVERMEQAPAASEASAATPPATVETTRLPIALPASVVPGEQLPLAGSYALKLAPLNLAKGDRLKLTLVATDFRGEAAPGIEAASEALVLEVADESQVLAAIRQADERSEAQLNEIIRRQLGVGQDAEDR